MSKEALSEEERVVTHWSTCGVRMHREGNLYQLEILELGANQEIGRFVTLDEKIALALGDIWLT